MITTVTFHAGEKVEPIIARDNKLFYLKKAVLSPIRGNVLAHYETRHENR